MNGELAAMADLVLVGKNYLRNDIIDRDLSDNHSNSNIFNFIDKSSQSDVVEWFIELKKRNLVDIKFITQDVLKDIHGKTAFVNTVGMILITFYHDKTTYWSVKWSFDDKIKKWNVVYTEHECSTPLEKGMVFENRRDDFLRVLREIKTYADRHEIYNFSNCFQSAIDSLETKYTDSIMPEENTQLFNASYNAWVFGGMGSWNDIRLPNDKECDIDLVTNRLYRELVYALMYAVNEW